jgi:hypothetical protein
MGTKSYLLEKKDLPKMTMAHFSGQTATVCRSTHTTKGI